MDFYGAIRELLEEKKRLDRLIAALEDMESGKVPETGDAIPHKRGRKAMSADERRIVSERMRRYWASRRENGVAENSSSTS